MKSLQFFLFFIFSCFLACPGGADQSEIEEAVKNLGAAKFEDRQAASDFLWRQGVNSFIALKKAGKSSDPEVRFRAKDILKKINFGIFPGMPKKISNRLIKFPELSSNEKNELVKEIADMGDAGLESLNFLVANQLEKGDVNYWPFFHLLEDSKFLRRLLSKSPRWDPLIENILKMGFLSGNFSSYLSWTVENGKLDERIVEFEKLTEGPNSDKYLTMLAFLYRMAGRLPEARTAAEKSNAEWLALRIAMEMEDFAYCLKKYPEMVKNEDGIHPLAWQAILQRLSGKEKDFKKTIAIIEKTPDLDDSSSYFAAEALLINGQISKAIDKLRKRDTSGISLGIFQQYTDEFIAANEYILKEKGLAPLPYVEFLHYHGEKAKAQELFNKIADKALKKGEDENKLWLPRTVATAVKINHPAKDKLIAFALNSTDIDPETLAQTIYPKTSYLWDFIQMKYADKNIKQRFVNYLDLIGNMPKGPAFIDLLKESGKQIELMPNQEQAGNRMILAEYYRQLGRKDEELAEIMSVIKLEEKPFFMIQAGDWYAEQKNWKKALEWYGETVKKYPEDELALILFGHALIKNGKENEGKKKIKLGQLLILGNMEKRLFVAANLEKRGLNQLALHEYNLIKASEFYNSWYLIRAYERIPFLSVKLNQKNAFAKNARYFRLATFEYLNASRMGNALWFYFWRQIFHYRLYKTRAFMAIKNYQEAYRQYQKSSVMAETNLDDTIEIINDFKRCRQNLYAEKIYQTVKNRLLKNLEILPHSTDFRNSLAWLMSRTHRDLDVALKLSKEAVALAPGNAAYMDTLAEVYFNLKNREMAVEWQKKAMEAAPVREKSLMSERLKHFQQDHFPAD